MIGKLDCLLVMKGEVGGDSEWIDDVLELLASPEFSTDTVKAPFKNWATIRWSRLNRMLTASLPGGLLLESQPICGSIGQAGST